MSWEDAYTTMSEIMEADRIKEETERKGENASMEEQFQLLYPTIPWDRLQKSSSDITTNDASTHYMDVNTKQIYSWNYRSKRWHCYPEEYQRGIRRALFNVDIFQYPFKRI
jgi:hypothetical protein